jgi:polysaccharide deacetylase 2 family uncharacterized protein YibQ
VGRGFLSGIFWGGIVGLVALFVSSQTLERQVLSFPQPDAAEVEVPGGSEFNQARPEADPVMPGTDARPESDTAAGVAVPDETGTEPPALDTATLEVPVPATTQEAPEGLGDAPDAVSDITEPPAQADSSVAAPSGDALVTPEEPGQAPEAAVADVAAPTVDQSDDAAPEVTAREDTAPGDDASEIAALPATETAPADTTAATVPPVTGQTDAPVEPTVPDVPEQAPLPWETGAGDTAIDEAPEAPKLPWMTDEPSLPPVGSAAPDAPEVAGEPAPSTDDAVSAAIEEALADANGSGTDEPTAPDEPDRPDPESSVLQPVETFTEREEPVGPDVEGSDDLPVVRRFGDNTFVEDEEDAPALATEDDAATDAGEAELAEAPDASEEPSAALQAFATDFEAPEGLPLMSIILVHQGDLTLQEDVLQVLPPYVGFAVDASLPNAAEIARAYRASGREVVMIPALPAGAAPQDIEQALAANFDLVPEAVAVMDVSGSSFQSDRAAVEQVVDVVSASGHGLITFPRGLNTAHQAAQRAGVPTGLIFRNIDGGSETQEQIRRTLDRAAFRARQDEAVILVGTTGATTLSALTEWLLGNRATTVAIAPVSAALGG